MATTEPVGSAGPSGDQAVQMSRTVALVDLRPIASPPGDADTGGRTMASDLALRKSNRWCGVMTEYAHLGCPGWPSPLVQTPRR